MKKKLAFLKTLILLSIVNLFFLKTRCLMKESEESIIETNENTQLIFDIDKLAKSNRKKELYRHLYEFLNKHDFSTSEKILEHLKKIDPELNSGSEYLARAIIERNKIVATFWVENLAMNYNHVYLALQASEDMTNIILKKFHSNTENSTENRKKLYDICMIIKERDGLPKNLILYFMLFSVLRNLVKITPKHELIGYGVLKKFVEENNIINMDKNIPKNKLSYEKL